jgi:phosphomannomutase/phosphoglucomutase
MSEPLPPEPSGTLDTRDVLPAYERWVVQQAHELADAWKLRSAADSPNVSLRIVVDTMAGAFTHVAPRVLASAGHLVTPLGGEIDPDFAARTPNPSEDANLEPLIEAVMRERADLGVAFDGDGDRVIFVDAHGQIVRPEQIAVLLVQHCFERPTVVYDLKCASILSRAVEAVGGRAIMQPSGHGFIKATMIEERAELGVEVSGHHFFGVLDGGDDGLFTALLVAEIVTQTNRSLAELIAPIGWPAITPDLRVPFSGDATEAIEAIGRTCGGHVTRLDGVRAAYDHGWALARASITEPAITFRFEGRDQADLRRVVAQFLAAVPALCRQVMEMIDE